MSNCLICVPCKERADEGGVTELQLWAGEADGEHGIKTVLDFGVGTKPRIIKGGAAFSPAKEAVEFDELNFLNDLFDWHKQIV